eukprot:8205776-Pyramimonas_sp.AAC.1
MRAAYARACPHGRTVPSASNKWRHDFGTQSRQTSWTGHKASERGLCTRMASTGNTVFCTPSPQTADPAQGTRAEAVVINGPAILERRWKFACQKGGPGEPTADPRDTRGPPKAYAYAGASSSLHKNTMSIQITA